MKTRRLAICLSLLATLLLLPAACAPAEVTPGSEAEVTPGPEAEAAPEADDAVAVSRLVMPIGPGPTDPLFIQAFNWATRLSERTDGNLRVDIFHSGQLGSASDTYQQFLDGTIDVYWGGVQNVVDITALAYMEAAYVWEGRDHVVEYMANDFEGAFGDELEAIDVRYLGFAPGEPRVISTRGKRIDTPDDLAGLLIRAPEFEGLFESINAMGARSTIIPFPELYVALETGVADGQENPLTRIASQKFYEVQTNVALTNHVWEVNLMLVNRATWDALPPEHQQVMLEESQNLAQEYFEVVEPIRQEAVEEIEGAGVEINEVDQSLFRAKTLEVMEPRYREVFGDDLWESIQGAAP